jgi:hypothetical protein
VEFIVSSPHKTTALRFKGVQNSNSLTGVRGRLTMADMQPRPTKLYAGAGLILLSVSVASYQHFAPVQTDPIAEVKKAVQVCVPYKRTEKGSQEPVAYPDGWTKEGKECAHADAIAALQTKGFTRLIKYWRLELSFIDLNGKRQETWVSTAYSPLIVHRNGRKLVDLSATMAIDYQRYKHTKEFNVEVGDKIQIVYSSSGNIGIELPQTFNEPNIEIVSFPVDDLKKLADFQGKSRVFTPTQSRNSQSPYSRSTSRTSP